MSSQLSLELSIDGSKVIGTVRSSGTSDTDTVSSLLKTMEGFDKDTLKALSQVKLSALTSVPKKVAELWNTSTTSIPILFSSEDCWTRTPPQPADLILETLDVFAKTPRPTGRFTTYRRGEADQKVDPRMAIVQLSHPNSQTPITVFGLNVPSVSDDLLKCPLALSKVAEPYDESNHQLLLTPRFAQSDLHIDCSDGLSIPIGNCTKIWIVFPPTPQNLTLFSSFEGRKALMHHIGNKLEGGLIFQTTSSQGVYLPVGILHAVYTTTGGFLNAVDFTTPESFKTYAQLFEKGLDGRSESFQEDSFRFFLRSVDLGLDGKEKMALQTWVAACDRILEYGERNAKWRKEAILIWGTYLKRKGARKRQCPCGRSAKGEFVEHFLGEHLWGRDGKRKRGSSRNKRKETNTLVAVPKAPVATRMGLRSGKRERVEEEEEEEERDVKKVRGEDVV